MRERVTRSAGSKTKPRVIENDGTPPVIVPIRSQDRGEEEERPGVRRTKREENDVDLAVSGFQRSGPTVADGLSFETIALDKLGLAILDEGLHLFIVVESIG